MSDDGDGRYISSHFLAKGQAQAKDQFSECMDDIFVSISISGRKEGKREGNSRGIKAHKEILGIIAQNRTEMFG